MGVHGELAAQAAREAGRIDNNEALGDGLAAVAFALLEVADAIREASSKD